MATITKRQTADGLIRYRVQIRLRGHPAQQATFKRLSKARIWAKKTETAIAENRYFQTIEARRHTLGELVDRYLLAVLPAKSAVAGKQAPQLEWWRDNLGELLLSNITPSRIAEARDTLSRGKTRTGRRRAPATVNRHLAALSHAFTIAVKEWGWLESNPCMKVRRLKEPQGRVRFLDDGERERLLKACEASQDSRLYPLAVLAVATGMRQGEILGLTWAAVDLKRGHIVLTETKNRDRRGVPLVGHALDALRSFAKVRRLGSDSVFPGPNGPPTFPQKAWLKALKDAEVEDFRFHDLRHSAASYLAMNGATPSEIAAVLGHRTLAMVKRYAHLSDAHTAEVVRKMNERIFGGDR